MFISRKKRSEKAILNYYQHQAPISAMDSPTFQRVIIGDWLGQLARKINLKKLKVLDFGCGIGNNLRLLSQDFAQVIAVDVSLKALTLAKKNHQAKNIKFRLIDSQKLPFKNSAFDFILAAEVLEHVPNLQRTVSELERILAVDGYLLISSPNYSNLRGISKKIIDFLLGEGYWDPARSHPEGYERFMTPKKILSHLKNFKIINTCGSDYGTAWSPPMVKMYPKKFDNFFEISLGKIAIFKNFGMNYYLLAQKK